MSEICSCCNAISTTCGIQVNGQLMCIDCALQYVFENKHHNQSKRYVRCNYCFKFLESLVEEQIKDNFPLPCKKCYLKNKSYFMKN